MSQEYKLAMAFHMIVVTGPSVDPVTVTEYSHYKFEKFLD
jgi:hypothetical protein